MPVIDIYFARLDFERCSGMIYSFQQIEGARQDNLRVLSIGMMKVQTPEGYVLQDVREASPYGDVPNAGEPLLFDPVTTAHGRGGRVYMRAARVVERLRYQDSEFCRVG